MNVFHGPCRLAGGLLRLCLVLPLAADWAVADDPPWRGAGKPEAPVEVRWLEAGAEGRVSVEVVPGIDYDGLELQLLVARPEGLPSRMMLGGGQRGDVRRAGWFLAAPPSVAPRLLVILVIGGHQIGRTVMAPDLAGAPEAGLDAPQPRPDDHGVIPMRADERRSRAGEDTPPPE